MQNFQLLKTDLYMKFWFVHQP